MTKLMKFTGLTVYFPQSHCPQYDLWVACSYQLNIIFDCVLAGVAVPWLHCAPSPEFRTHGHCEKLCRAAKHNPIFIGR